MIAVYPGSFDPITNGHVDIIKRCARIYDKIYVAVLNNISKNTLFSISERIEMIKKSINIPNIEICSFSGILIDFAESVGAKIIIRGIRSLIDFEYEFQYSINNKILNPNIETILLTARPEFFHISSSVVKELSFFKKNVSNMVPNEVAIRLTEKYLK